jgi:two-component system response regulator RegA
MDSQTPTGTTLLLIDDDEAFLRVMGQALRRRGFDVLAASTGREGLSLARAHRPSHAVVDLKLESETGLDMIPGLKELNRSMVIVLLTGYASIATAVEAIKLGADNYLPKPVRIDELTAALAGKQTSPPGGEALAPMSVDRLEWEHIQKVLQENDGNISATARSLGMYRRTLQRKLAKKPVQK